MTLSRDDRRALRAYLRAFSWAVGDYLGTPLRRLRADLRDQTLAAAAEVGMTRALGDLGEPRELAERYAEEHGRRGPRGGRRAVRSVAILAALAAAVGAVIGVRALPRVDLGYARWSDPDFALEGDAFDVRWVAHGVGAGSRSIGMQIHNPRPFAVTVTGVDALTSRVRLSAGTDRFGGLAELPTSDERVESVTIPADGYAWVWVAFSLPCAPFEAEGSIGTDRADLEVCAFGITRSRSLPLGGTYMVSPSTDWLPPADCTPGEPR